MRTPRKAAIPPEAVAVSPGGSIWASPIARTRRAMVLVAIVTRWPPESTTPTRNSGTASPARVSVGWERKVRPATGACVISKGGLTAVCRPVALAINWQPVAAVLALRRNVTWPAVVRMGLLPVSAPPPVAVRSVTRTDTLLVSTRLPAASCTCTTGRIVEPALVV